MDCKVFLDAQTYSNNHRLVKEIVTDAVRLFFPLDTFYNATKGQCTMLDLGCGTCENTRWFGKQVHAQHIVGLDWNPNFLQHAAQQDKTSNNYKLDLHLVNLNNLHWHSSLPALSYDLITSFLTLHWVKNLTNCLETLKTIMVPRKTIMFHVLGIKPGPNFQATMKDLATTQKWGPIIKAFAHSTRWQDPSIADWRAAPDPAGAFRDILLAAGFSVSVCTKMAFTYATASEAECRGHLNWLVPFTSELPPDERQSLMDDFMSAYERHTRQEAPGRYVWENEVLVVIAQRDAPAADDGAACGGSRAAASGSQ